MLVVVVVVDRGGGGVVSVFRKQSLEKENRGKKKEGRQSAPSQSVDCASDD
jgi:hypothetical protein